MSFSKDLIESQPTALQMKGTLSGSLESRMACFAKEKNISQSLPKILDLMISMAGLVAELHQEKKAHCFLSPTSFLVDESSGQIFALEHHGSKTPKVNPRYTSPEVIGKTSSAADTRSDLYSLGCIFYELLCGKPPFEFTENTQLRYSHIARTAEPLSIMAPELPEFISKIIEKLMAKSQDARYQTAYGLIFDLELIKNCLAQGKNEAPLTVGTADRIKPFQLNEKLYGRELEIEKLLNAYIDISKNKHSKLIMVSGNSGVGKSRLIGELHKPIAKLGGQIATGKCDQFKKGFATSCLVSALEGKIARILASPKERIDLWAQKIDNVLGENVSVISTFLPILEQLPLKTQESANGIATNRVRFEYYFTEFCQLFADEQNPLVLFLDDLQWADPITLDLIKLLTVNPEIKNIFIIGAYRKNEILPTDHLFKTIKNLKESKKLEEIHLELLNQDAIHDWIADSLYLEKKECAETVSLAMQKTFGNPFFLSVWFQELQRYGALEFLEKKGSWSIKTTSAMMLKSTKNVVDVLVARIIGLPSTTTKILSLASLLSNCFDLFLVSDLLGIKRDKAFQYIKSAIDDGLVTPLSNRFLSSRKLSSITKDVYKPLFKFSHDRIQQAFSEIIPKDKKPRCHLQIAQYLQKKYLEGDEEKIIALSFHFFQAKDLISSDSKKRSVASFHLRAAEKCRYMSSFHTGKTFAINGISLLPENSSQTDYTLFFSLHFQKANLHYLCLEYLRAIKTLENLLAHRLTLPDKAKVSILLSRCYRMQNCLEKALRINIEMLNQLGLQIEAYPDKSVLQSEIEFSYKQIIASEEPFPFTELPFDAQDGMTSLKTALLAESLAPAYFLGSQLSTIIGLKIVRLIFEDKHLTESASFGFAFSCFTLATVCGDYQKAGYFRKLALAVSTQKSERSFEATVMNIAGLTSRYTEPLDKGKEYFTKGIHSGIEFGMYQWSGYCAINLLSYDLFGNQTFQQTLEHTIKKIGPKIGKYDCNMFQYFLIFKAMIANLRHASDDFYDFSEDYWPGGRLIIARCKESNDLLTLFQYYLAKLALALFFEDFNSAIEFSNKAKQFEKGALGLFTGDVFLFYRSLSLGYKLSGTYPRSELAQEEFTEIKSIQHQFQIWSRHSPSTYRNMYLIISGISDFIERAPLKAIEQLTKGIEEAKENQMLLNSALGSQALAYFLKQHQVHTLERQYRVHYLKLYNELGAEYLAQYLKSKHQHSPSKVDHSIINKSALDNNVLLSLSRDIASEIKLPNLLEKLLGILLENLGARFACVFLKEPQDTWNIAASKQIDAGVTYDKTSLPKYREALCSEVASRVAKSTKALILKNASEDFVSSERLNHNIRSVASVPIKRGSNLIAIVYLENDLLENAFDPSLLKFIEHLGAQIAISLENAILYKSLEARVKSRTNELEKALKKLQVAKNQLVENEKLVALGELSAGIAHEIKNPLNIVVNAAEMIKMEAQEIKEECSKKQIPIDISSLEELCDLAKSSGFRANEIITNMLSHSRGEKAHPARFCLASLIKDQLNLTVDAKMGQKSNSIIIDLNFEFEPEMYSIHGDLSRVLVNLIDNAVDAVNANTSTPEKRIGISTKKVGEGYVKISVKDNGTGVPSNISKRIFEPFFTTKPTGSGTGLGLSIVHNLVEISLHGKISVQSKQEEYSIFHITLPIDIRSRKS